MTPPDRPTIWWIRRDLRLADNQALSAALEKRNRVLPVFILDPFLLSSPFVGQKRLAFLLAGLRELDKELQARGGRLIVRRGDPLEQLEAIMDESNAEAIYAEADYSPYARRRDAEVLSALPLELTEGVVVHPPGSVLKNDGDPYVVFTPFCKTWKEITMLDNDDLLTAPEEINTIEDIETVPIPDEPELSQDVPFIPGPEKGGARLEAFVSGSQPPIYDYEEQRNFMDSGGTSKLSPYLRFGMVSARQAVVGAKKTIEDAPNEEARKGAETWLNELIWREFYVHILYHFPKVRGQSFRSKYQDIPWINDEDDFQVWCQGKTGYPIVDAPMRQLRREGWIHNRARMIVASFLVKDLLVDWRWGEKWFMQHLLDGDPAANNGGWQWTAGTGTDAAPYFRIFNPVLQGKKFDPDGRFIRRWIPELSEVPDKFIHAPWKMSRAEQAEADCVIGKDYPPPIIEHSYARERTLEAYDVA